ncbi:MAG: dihydropteroate synthase [Ginsengibacter sp.]
MFSLNCKGKPVLIEKPLVMGILNLTPDSFYAGSRLQNMDEVFNKACKMINEGADILDIGGQSTRPGSERISKEEEMQKVLPAIEMLIKKFDPVILSIDTYHSGIAKEAVNAGASIVNDISGGTMDKNMLETVASLNVPYICMHIKGVPETMHLNASYETVVKEILDFFIQKINECRLAGIKDVIVDPGFGFGKTVDHNFTLLKNLSIFKMLERPVMTGISRKSTIYKTLNIDIEDSLNGTTILNTLALHNGANILRVHDVKEAKEAVTLFEAYANAKA